MEIYKIGFCGIGNMGPGMVKNLMKAGHDLTVFDIRQEAVDALVKEGAKAASDHADLVKHCDIVMTSLPYPPIFVEVMDNYFIDNARAGQVFIDMGTSSVQETQRIAAVLRAKGAELLDAPVSGGKPGSDTGTLHIFIGGRKSVYDKYALLFEVMGNPEHVVYCGESGSGQVVKGVNQLAIGLVNAAFIETIAYGVLAGVSAEALKKGVGGEGGFRRQFTAIADKFIQGKAEQVEVKIGQIDMFLDAANHLGFELPLTRTLYHFCENGEKRVMDANRLSQSYWHELTLRASGYQS
ncbi:NAD(P)-dependent oxidoreductase [Paenibacillus piri]|uniref:NAD(P)-dependent oxidoreductase n=1 Tax=Paenibacillus piri TaxID=2547395 RepID=A0A4R5KSE1_9BACL|nr:NAD(P)-dependent oxidoreductase [Paenibacillus piri]TDF98701.1 NAD(P)-dependent oxidoreductase [Paenibacillus piri]